MEIKQKQSAIKIAAAFPGDTEVACRKRLATNPGNLKIWAALLMSLRQQGNMKELSLMTDKILDFFPENIYAIQLCLNSLLSVLDIDRALHCARKLHQLGKLAELTDAKDFYHLGFLLKDISPSKLIKNYYGIQAEIINFNATFYDLNLSSADVVCYIAQPFHYSIQKDIAFYLRNQGIRVVLSESIWFAIAMKPKILLTSEALYNQLDPLRKFLPNCMIVNTRHGLGDKNHAALGASQADRICVSSEHIANLFINNYLVPKHKVWVTGSVQMDALFQKSAIERSHEGYLSNCRKTILFAPTYNPELSSAFFLRNDIAKLIRGHDDSIGILIRPHPHIIRDNPEMIDNWLKQASTANNLYVNVDQSLNIMDIYDQFDLMISDVSSAALAWIATHRPLICLVDKSAAISSVRYAADGLEWKMLEYVDVVDNPSLLSEVVKRSLERDNLANDKLKRFSEFLFGSLKDGKSYIRVADKIVECIRGL
jgi:hypothetical protein